MYYSTGTNNATNLCVMDLETKAIKVYDDEVYSYGQAPYILNIDIYFLDSYNQANRCGTLQRKSFDGNNKVQIIDIPVRTFQIYDGWIYYTDYNFSLHRARLDGTEDKVIFSDGYIDAFAVSDNLVFIADYETFVTQLDGSNYQKFDTQIILTDFFYTVTDDHIYYMHDTGNGRYNQLYRINKDGTDMQLMPFCVDW